MVINVVIVAYRLLVQEDKIMLVSRLSEEFITQKAKENWLSYWKYFSKSSHEKCSVPNCAKNHNQAIFVADPNDQQESIYVVPLCAEHGNNESNQLEIQDNVELVPIGFTL